MSSYTISIELSYSTFLYLASVVVASVALTMDQYLADVILAMCHFNLYASHMAIMEIDTFEF